jgi:tRNA (adenine57-N1/adenine58-N1)-methyltransferase
MIEEPGCARAGDTALLIGKDRREYLIRLESGRVFETHRGVLPHDDLIGQPWGSAVKTHLGHPYLLLRPALSDRILHLPRVSQIIYPKDAGYILLKMNIGPGSRVIEAGTGSGGLTLALAHAVRPTGRVYSYDVRADMQNLARRNLEKADLAEFVELILHDITDGFTETGVDALFLDVPNPWDYLAQAHAALVSGGFFGAILPTTNQVSRLLEALQGLPFGLVEVEELLQRPYKPVAARLRPVDRMVAHTGFLIFARALAAPTLADTGTVAAEGEEAGDVCQTVDA